MNIKIIYGFLATVILASCTTFPVPKPNDSTLVIGMVVLNAKGYENYSGATVNGTHTGNIEISIQNVDSGRTEKLISDSSGFFYTNKFEPGKYRLRKLYYKSSVGGYNADIFTSITNGDRNFEVGKNTVNNLGQITWNADVDEGMQYWLNKDYQNSKDVFTSVDKDGKWNAIAIEDVTFQK